MQYLHNVGGGTLRLRLWSKTLREKRWTDAFRTRISTRGSLPEHKALETVVTDEHVDYVMAGIVGAAGLLPNLAAAKAGKARHAGQ